MGKAVIYARYSSDKQTEDSIEAQLRACNEYAAAKGYEVVGKYVDEAISGKAAKTLLRREYQRMIRDAARGLFGVILIHKFDRVARSLAEHVNLEKRLNDKGIELIAVAQDFGQTKEAKIMRALMWSMSEYYVDNLSEEVKKGHKETALKALHNGGKPAFGYDVNNQTYTINELEAGYVRKMFDCARKGLGYKALIEEMASAGIKGKLGKPIKYTQIYEILRNERYTGVYIYSPTKYKTREDRRKKPGAIRVEGAVPAIIDKQLFTEVQKIMDSKSHVGAKSDYLCSGLVYCSCGAKMHAHKTKPRDEEYFYYECAKRCGQPSVEMAIVDDAAKSYLNELLSEKNEKLIFEALQKYQAGEGDRVGDFLRAVKAKVDQKQKEYETLSGNMAKADLPPEILQDLIARLAEIKSEIAALNEVEPPEDYTVEQINAWLESIKAAPNEKAVHLLVERIDVNNKTDIKVTSTLISVFGNLGAADRT